MNLLHTLHICGTFVCMCVCVAASFIAAELATYAWQTYCEYTPLVNNICEYEYKCICVCARVCNRISAISQRDLHLHLQSRLDLRNNIPWHCIRSWLKDK